MYNKIDFCWDLELVIVLEIVFNYKICEIEVFIAGIY